MNDGTNPSPVSLVNTLDRASTNIPQRVGLAVPNLVPLLDDVVELQFLTTEVTEVAQPSLRDRIVENHDRLAGDGVIYNSSGHLELTKRIALEDALHLDADYQGVLWESVIAIVRFPRIVNAYLDRAKVSVTERSARGQDECIPVSGLPLATCHLGQRDYLEPFSCQRASDRLAVQVCPDGPSFTVFHSEDVIQQPKDLKGMEPSIEYGIEPDPRATFNSIGDK